MIAAMMAALLAAAPMASAPAPKMADLEWLSGSWVSETGTGWVEEQWSDARGGMMLGTNRTGKGGTATAFEYMRIQADEKGTIQFWGSPSGAPPVAFPLVSLSHDQAVFENPRHDYPTRIVYRLGEGRLVGTISGPGGENPVSWEFRRKAVR